MGDAIMKWFGAGVVTTGLVAAMLAGTGVAMADDDSSANSSPASTSEASNSPADTADSAADAKDDASAEQEPAVDQDELSEEEPAVDDDEPAVDEEEPAEPVVDDEQPAVDGEQPAVETEEEAATDVAEDRSDSDREVDTTSRAHVKQPAAQPVEPVVVGTEPEDTAAVEQNDDEGFEPAATPASQQRTTVVVEDIAAQLKDVPKVEAITFAAAAPAVGAAAFRNPLTTVLDFIGTVVFGIYGAVTRLFGGPAVLPLGSTVTVRSTTLRLDCGCAPGEGSSVPVDWYFPEGALENPPDRMIYLQHGFLAAGPWYSYTAAALASQTGSIVVAPSITSNFLAADACWLGAPTMHQAIAGLFDEDNTALAESATRVGYSGPIPDRVVLMGHSLGGGAVSGAAGYMVDNGSIGRLAGVVLLDGVGLDDSMTDALRKVPLDIPIYQIAAPRYFWNQFGVGSAALMAARPGQFVGVTLVGGSHVDTMRGGNALIQFAQQAVSGFSQPRNVAAARHLMVTWANDMFAGNQATGVYDLAPGERLEMRNPGGLAVLVGLPNPLTKLFPLNLLQPFVQLGDGIFRFEPACVAASVGAAAGGACSNSIAA